MFGQYDENGDGKLDLAELAKYVVSINDYADTEDVEVWIYYLLLLQYLSTFIENLATFTGGISS